MRFRIKLLRRHKIMTWVIVLILALFGFSTYLQNKLTASQIQTHLLRVFEKKYWSELETFHTGQVTLADNYFTRALDTVSRLSSRDELTEAVIEGNTSLLHDVLNRQRETNQVVNGLYLLNREGVMIVESSVDNTFTAGLGTSFADREYFKEVMRAKAAGTSPVLKSRTGNYGITFCSPFMNKGEVEAVLCGAVSLESLAKYLSTAEISNKRPEFLAVLTDSQGNVLYENQQLVAEPVSIKDDKVLAALFAGQESYKAEEVNYKNEHVFAVAERISVGPNSSIFNISYLAKTEAASEREQLNNTLGRINAANAFRTLLLTIIACLLIGWVIRKHDEQTS